MTGRFQEDDLEGLRHCGFGVFLADGMVEKVRQVAGNQYETAFVKPDPSGQANEFLTGIHLPQVQPA